MAGKICSNCDAQLPPTAVFCTRCGGAELVDHVEPTPDVTAPVAAPTTMIAPDAPTTPLPGFEAVSGSSAPTMPVAPTDAPNGPMPAVSSPWASGAPQPSSPATPAPMPAPTTPPTVGAPAAPWAATPEPTAPSPVGPSGSPARPDAAAPSPQGGGRFGAFIALLGAGAAIAGAFLPWLKITPSWADAFSIGGWNLSMDAKIIAGIGGFAVIVAVVVLGGAARRPGRVLIAIAGIALIGIGGYDTYDLVQRLPDALTEAGVAGIQLAAPGLGLILVMVGGGVALLGALAMVGDRSPDAGGVPGQATPVAPGSPAGGTPTYPPTVGPQAPMPGSQAPMPAAPPTAYPQPTSPPPAYPHAPQPPAYGSPPPAYQPPVAPPTMQPPTAMPPQSPAQPAYAPSPSPQPPPPPYQPPSPPPAPR